MGFNALIGPDLDLPTVAELAAQLRVDSIRCTTSAGSGHPTSSMSAADLLASLLARHLHYDWNDPANPANDHLLFSKGHASPLLYSVFKAAGVIADDELMTGYRRLGQRLEGHPTPVLPWVDVATGSLGQGLPDGVGIALAGKYLDRRDFIVWVLCGDSEMAEGSIWEALDRASHYHLSNLGAIIDVNRLGQRGETDLGWNIGAYAARAEAFGARVITIDGHDLEQIDKALSSARDLSGDRPTVVVAKTIKGKGFSEIEDQPGWHGKALPQDMAHRALAELGGERTLLVRGPLPDDISPDTPHGHRTGAEADISGSGAKPTWRIGDHVATRQAYGDALVALGARDDKVVALDGEVSNSTYTGEFARAFPDRYFEMLIVEQQLVAAATGLASRGYIAFASTFAAFLTRAHDFIRMGAISRANLCLVGSHAGVEIGADGPSQMGLGRPGDDACRARLHRALSVRRHQHRCPGDRGGANSRDLLLAHHAGAYPVLYESDEEFHAGGSKVLAASDHDEVTLIGAGVTVHQCLDAADRLAGAGISARVVDCYSVKPIDTDTLLEAAAATHGRLIVAEDHHPEGGLGSAVADAVTGLGEPLTITRLAVDGMPGSGTGPELLAWAGIDAEAIASAARSLTRG